MAKPINSDTPPDVAGFEKWAVGWGLLVLLTTKPEVRRYWHDEVELAWQTWQARGRSKAAPKCGKCGGPAFATFALLQSGVQVWECHECFQANECGDGMRLDALVLAAREALDDAPAPEPEEAKPKVTVEVDPCHGVPYAHLHVYEGGLSTMRWAKVHLDEVPWFTARLTGDE